MSKHIKLFIGLALIFLILLPAYIGGLTAHAEEPLAFGSSLLGWTWNNPDIGALSEPFVFMPKLAGYAIVLPEPQTRKPVISKTVPKLKQAPKIELLAKACGGDEKCTCLNDAVFTHDSSWATAGVGMKANNPGNMRVPSSWKPSVPMGVYKAPGNGRFAKFRTLEHGIVANVELYKRYYKDASAEEMYRAWTATEKWDARHPPAYLVSLRSCFL